MHASNEIVVKSGIVIPERNLFHIRWFREVGIRPWWPSDDKQFEANSNLWTSHGEFLRVQTLLATGTKRFKSVHWSIQARGLSDLNVERILRVIRQIEIFEKQTASIQRMQ